MSAGPLTDRVGRDIRAQAWAGASVTVVGFAVPAAILLLNLYLPAWAWLVVVAYTLACLRYASTQLRAVGTRSHGRRLEHSAVRAARKALPRRGLEVRQASMPIATGGDMDMLVARGSSLAPVEIKSFKRWDPRAERCQHALAQADREARAIHVEQAFVWLPDASAGWRGPQHYDLDAGRGVWVVCGSARALAAAMRRHLP